MFDIEQFRLPKDFVVTGIVAKHTADCVVHEDGPCTCGLDDFIEEEMLEEIRMDMEAEERHAKEIEDQDEEYKENLELFFEAN
jgi:hypothetical protein